MSHEEISPLVGGYAGGTARRRGGGQGRAIHQSMFFLLSNTMFSKTAFESICVDGLNRVDLRFALNKYIVLNRSSFSRNHAL